MHKISLSLLLFVFLFPAVSNAQIVSKPEISIKDLLKSDGNSELFDSLLQESLRPALIISRQSFQVRDKETGDLYGLNNNDEFGTDISLGVRVGKALILTDHAINPWNYNSKYDAYRDKYDPVLSRSDFAGFPNGVFSDTLDFSKAKVAELFLENVYSVAVAGSNIQGLQADNTEGTRKGWMVWACQDKASGANSNPVYELVVRVADFDVKSGTATAVDALKGRTIIGGIFITPSITGVGRLDFKIAGVAVEKGGQWKVAFPFAEADMDEDNEELTPQDRSIVEPIPEEKVSDSLTPVDDMYGGNEAKPAKKSKNKRNKK